MWQEEEVLAGVCAAGAASAAGSVAHMLGAAGQGAASIARGGAAAGVLGSTSWGFMFNTLRLTFAAGRATLDMSVEDSVSDPSSQVSVSDL